MASGFGAGAAEGLESVLSQLFMQQKQKQLVAQQQAELSERARQADASRGLQSRGLDLTQRGQDLSEGRFQTTRSDELAAAQAAAQSAAARGQKQDELIAGLPAWAQAPARGQTLGLKLDAADLTEAPETREQKMSREFGDFEKRQGTMQTGQLRLEGARQAGALQLEGMRQSGREKPEQAKSPYSQERGRRVLQSVDELEKKVSNWTVGPGSVLSNIPATDARNFDAELNTLKSNIAFNELTEMREASKTGGALGQVSDKEAQLLQSALGALDTGQSPANLRAQLRKIRESVQRWDQAKAGGQAAGGGEFDYVPGKGLVPRGGR